MREIIRELEGNWLAGKNLEEIDREYSGTMGKNKESYEFPFSHSQKRRILPRFLAFLFFQVPNHEKAV